MPDSLFVSTKSNSNEFFKFYTEDHKSERSNMSVPSYSSPQKQQRNDEHHQSNTNRWVTELDGYIEKGNWAAVTLVAKEAKLEADKQEEKA